jgi:hypothetical protein
MRGKNILIVAVVALGVTVAYDYYKQRAGR